MKHVIRALAIAGATLACASTASAATIQVETKNDQFGPGGTGKCALREAVQAANTNASFGGCSKGQGSDRVVLGNGVYGLTIAGTSEDDNADGDIDIDANIRITGKGAKKTTIDGNGNVLQESMFDVNSGGATFQGITMRNGRDADDEYGGAIHHESPGNLTLTGMRFAHNVADYYGGAVYLDNDDADATVTKTKFIENQSGYYGGGFYADDGGDVTLRNVVADGNAADDGYGGGVGIYDIGGRLTIDKSRFTDNDTDEYYGGGLYADADEGVSIKRSTFAGNTSGIYSSGYGGGIYAYYTDITVRDSTISRNVAGDYGGGIYVDGADMRIVNSTISRNLASYNSGYGGGIYVDGPTEIESSTIVFNIGYYGAGLYEDDDVSYKNTIIAQNRTSYDGDTGDCYSSTAGDSLGHNFFGDDTCDATGPGDIQNGTYDAPSDPRLDVLGGYGGPTKTHRLLAGSPAINEGQGCPQKDQRGVQRTGRCDIGAFER